MLVERGDGDELTKYRGEEEGMEPKLGRPTPTFKDYE